MLPDVSSALSGWATPHTVIAVTVETVDFVPAETLAPRTVDLMAQPADKEKLNYDQLDWSLDYVTIHSLATIELGERITHNGTEYKIVSRGNWAAFGYWETLGEEIK